MTGKVKRKKLKTGFAFGSSLVFLFTFVLLLYCALFLVSCNESATKVAEVDQVQSIPAEEKKANLLKLLDKKFENPDAHYELGQLYQAEGLWPKAEYHYNVALSFDPTQRQAQAAMVKLFLDSGDTAKAKTYADTYVNQAKNSDIESLRLAMAFEKQQLDEYALTCFQQALSLAPDSARINKEMAYHYLGKNDKDRAKEYFVRSFQLDPRQPDVAGELGRLGVEVKIPTSTVTGAEDETTEAPEKKLKMVMRHGRVQFEPIDKE